MARKIQAWVNNDMPCVRGVRGAGGVCECLDMPLIVPHRPGQYGSGGLFYMARPLDSPRQKETALAVTIWYMVTARAVYAPSVSQSQEVREGPHD